MSGQQKAQKSKIFPSAGQCGSERKFHRLPLLDGATLLECVDHFLDAGFGEGRRVLLEKLSDPLFGEEGECVDLAGLHITVVVEDGQLVAGGQLLVLHHKFLEVLAPLEQLGLRFHPEGRLRTLPPRPAFHLARRPKGLGVDLDGIFELGEAELPVDLCGGEGRDGWTVLEADVGEKLALIQKSPDVVQVLPCESGTELGKSLANLLHLCLIGRPVRWDELTAALQFLELGGEVRGVDEEAPLVKPTEKRLEGLLLVGRRAFQLVKEVEEGLGPQEVTVEAVIERVLEHIDQFPHVLEVEEVEAKGVAVGGGVELAAAEAEPEGDVGADLRGDELGKSAQTGHGLRVGEAVDEVFGEVGPDGGKVLDLALHHQQPHYSVVQVQVAHHLAPRYHLSQRAVPHNHVRTMAAQRNRPQQSSPGEGVPLQFVAILDAGEVGKAGFELGLEVRVVEDSQRASVDVVDDRLLQSQQEGLALVDQDLRYVLVHDDGTLHQVLGQFFQFHVLVDLALLRPRGRGHLVGADLVEGVLAALVAAEGDQGGDLCVKISDGHVGEVVVGHLGSDVYGSSAVPSLQGLPDGHADGFLLGLRLGILLQKARLHVDELVLHLGVAVAAHVLGDDQLLDLLEVGLEVLHADLCELGKDLEVLLGVLHHRTEWAISSLAEDLALAVSREGAGDRHVGVVPPSEGVADCLVDLESFIFGFLQGLVALLDVVVHDFAVSDEDDVPVTLRHDLLRHLPRLVSATAPALGDEFFELFAAGEAGVVVPEIVVGDSVPVFGEDLGNDEPVVDEAAH